jgi:predicted nucleotidyltransferase
MITDEMAARYTDLGRQVAEYYENSICAFVSGSLIEGLGNSRSDLDVFVVSSHAVVESPVESVSIEVGEARVDITYSDGLRADTEVWDLESVRSAASELRGIEPGNRIAMMTVSPSRLELAHSVRVGLPVKE